MHEDYFPHFTNEEPEALAAQWLVPGHVAKKETEAGFKPWLSFLCS